MSKVSPPRGTWLRTSYQGIEREEKKPTTWRESNPWPQEFCSTAVLQPLPMPMPSYLEREQTLADIKLSKWCHESSMMALNDHPNKEANPFIRATLKSVCWAKKLSSPGGKILENNFRRRLLLFRLQIFELELRQNWNRWRERDQWLYSKT